MGLKINLHNFQSAARILMVVGGTASVFVPGATPIVSAIGGVSIGIAAAWGQINALLHPHDPVAAQAARDAIAQLASLQGQGTGPTITTGLASQQAGTSFLAGPIS